MVQYRHRRTSWSLGFFSCSYVDKTSMATSGPGPSKRAKLGSSQSLLDYFKPSSTPGPGSDRHASQQEDSGEVDESDVETEADELSEEFSDDEMAKSSDTEGRSTCDSVTPNATIRLEPYQPKKSNFPVLSKSKISNWLVY